MLKKKRKDALCSERFTLIFTKKPETGENQNSTILLFEKSRKYRLKITNYCKKQTLLYQTQPEPTFYAGFCKS